MPFHNALKSAQRRFRAARAKTQRKNVPSFFAFAVFLGGIIGAVTFGYAVFQLTGKHEASVRTVGGALDLLGLLYVALGLAGRTRSYNVPFSLQQLKKEFGILTGKGQIHYLLANSGGQSSVVGSPAILSKGHKGEPTIEERVTRLEKRTTKIRYNVDKLRDAQATETNERKQADDAESQERKAGDTAIWEKVREMEIGNIHLEWAGVLWIALGIVLGTWSQEIIDLLT